MFTLRCIERFKGVSKISLDSQMPHPVIQVPSQQMPKKSGIHGLHDCDAEIEHQTHNGECNPM